MRLICPGCGAQYEIDDALVPAAGRDVQCSACGHAWFQYPPETSGDPAPRQAQTASAISPAPEAEPTESTATRPPTREAPRRPIDPAVADVLRAEAAHEDRLRAQEAAQAPAPHETSPPEAPLAPSEHTADPPPPGGVLPPQAPSTSGRRARMGAAARTAQTDKAAPGTGAAGKTGAEPTRGGLLPDIESISSTLKPDDAHRDGPAGTQNSEGTADARSGFVQGFTAVIAAMVVLVLLYVFAGPLARAAPPLEAPLTGYVRLVDSALGWAAGLIDSITVWLRRTD